MFKVYQVIFLQD